jgi:hypothetical protein
MMSKCTLNFCYACFGLVMDIRCTSQAQNVHNITKVCMAAPRCVWALLDTSCMGIMTIKGKMKIIILYYLQY